MDIQVGERRIRKEIRLNKLLRKDEKVIVIDDGSAESKLSLYFLKKTNIPLKTTIKKCKYSLGDKISGNKVIIPWNADLEGEYFLNCIFDAKKPDHLGHFKIDKTKFIKLLLSFTSKEIKEISKSLKFRYVERKNVLDGLEEEYPEIKHSLLKSTYMFRK